MISIDPKNIDFRINNTGFTIKGTDDMAALFCSQMFREIKKRIPLCVMCIQEDEIVFEVLQFEEIRLKIGIGTDRGDVLVQKGLYISEYDDNEVWVGFTFCVDRI